MKASKNFLKIYNFSFSKSYQSLLAHLEYVGLLLAWLSALTHGRAVFCSPREHSEPWKLGVRKHPLIHSPTLGVMAETELYREFAV